MKSKEQDYIRSLCKEYIPTRRELPIIEADLDILRAKASQAKTSSGKRVFEFGIQKREEALKKAQDVISEYEDLVRGLDDKERMVITQLYSEGKTWKQLVDRKGKVVHPQKIARIRDNAIRHMSERMLRQEILAGGEGLYSADDLENDLNRSERM